MSGQRKSTAALDRAAQIIAGAIGAECERNAIAADDGVEEAFTGVRLHAALSEGAQAETGYCMGASEPYEIEHTAALEFISVEGTPEERRAIIEQAIIDSAEAIAADPTLGGLVDDAVVEEPDPDMADRYHGLEATLRLTYTAPTALG